MKKFLALLLLCFVSVFAWGADYYVDYGAADDTGVGTKIDPWKYCPGDTRSGNSLVSSDIVYFKLGVTYSGSGSSYVIQTTQTNLTFTVDATWGTGQAVMDGPSNAYFFWINHTGCSVLGLSTSYEIKFTGANMVNAAVFFASSTNTISSGTASYLEFDSISSSSGTEGIGVKVGVGDYSTEVSNVEVSYCNFHDCRSYGVKISAGTGSTHDCDIHHNIFEDNGVLGAEDLQVNISSNLGNGAYDISFHNNTLTDTSVGVIDGIEINNSPNKMYDNVFDGHKYTARFDPSYNSNKYGEIEIYGNVFKNSDQRGFNIGPTGSTIGWLKAYNNLFINNGDYVLNFMSTTDDNEFYNNTFYQTSGHVFWLQSGASGNIVKNNIAFSTGAIYEQADAGYTNNTEDYNCFYRETWNIIVIGGTGYNSTQLAAYRAAATPNGANTLFSNPTFENAPTDLRLQSGSAGINEGVDLSSEGFSTDYDGITRPQGAAWDIGAYEFVSDSFYYVDFVAGVDTNHGMTLAYPWKHAPGDAAATGDPAAVTILAGDTIILKGGVLYLGFIEIKAARYNDGTDQVLGSGAVGLVSGHLSGYDWGTGRAVIDGEDTRAQGIDIYDRDYMYIKGLEIKDCLSTGSDIAIMLEGATNCVLDDIYAHDCGVVASNSLMELKTISGQTTNDNNILKNCSFSESGEKLLEILRSGGNIIENNIFGRNGSHSISLNSTQQNVLRGNIIYEWGDDRASHAALHPSYAIKLSGNTANGACDDNVVYNNLMYDGGAGIGLYVEEGSTRDDNLFYENTIFNLNGVNQSNSSASDIGFYVLQNDPGATANNLINGNIFKNNICRTTGPEDGQYVGYAIRNRRVGSEEVGVGNNNIISFNCSHGDNALVGRIYVTAVWQYPTLTNFSDSGSTSPDYRFASKGTGNSFINTVESDPLFVSESAPYDLKLTATSPAKDIGDVLGAPYNVDIDGLSRPQGTGWDVGAYEAYVGSAAESKNVASWKFLQLIPGYFDIVLVLCIASVIMNLILLFLVLQSR